MSRPPFSARDFAEHRFARRGSSNPERMNNPVWEWLVRSRLSAYQAAQQVGERTGPGNPRWCFDRFGCSKTVLEDGRVIRIAGEHEDHYDPDFFIYNDVVVVHPDGHLDIHGYPPEVFPPTDFHSATPVGDAIYIVGNLGYVERRRRGTTPVFRLDLDSFAIREAPSALTGGPGWIHEHTAELSSDGSELIICRGIVERPATDSATAASDGVLVDNIDDWAYRLGDGAWRRLTRRHWQQWLVRRDDSEPLCLFEMSCMAFDAQILPADSRDIGARSFDRAVYDSLYQPSVDHVAEELDWGDEADDDGYRPADNTRHDQARIRIGPARIRYAADHREVDVKIEGAIDDDVAQRVVDDLVAKLTRLQSSACSARRVG